MSLEFFACTTSDCVGFAASDTNNRLVAHFGVKLLILLHSCGRRSRILHRVRYELVAEELVHLLEGLAFSLGEEEPIARKCDDVEDKEDVEVLELDRAKRLRGELGKNQVDGPVGESRDRVTESANFDREDLNLCVS